MHCINLKLTSLVVCNMFDPAAFQYTGLVIFKTVSEVHGLLAGLFYCWNKLDNEMEFDNIINTADILW